MTNDDYKRIYKMTERQYKLVFKEYADAVEYFSRACLDSGFDLLQEVKRVNESLAHFIFDNNPTWEELKTPYWNARKVFIEMRNRVDSKVAHRMRQSVRRMRAVVNEYATAAID